ncbi:MAG: DUF2993 domain-containing protein [Microbacterium sp.]
MSRAAKAGIASATVIVLLVVAAVAGEFIARRIVTNHIHDLVVNALALDDEHPIDISLGGIVLLQLASGKLDDVQASSDDVAWNTISGDVSADLHGLPTRGDDVSTLGGTAEIDLDAADLQTLVAQTPVVGVSLDDATVTLADGMVTVTSQATVLGMSLPVTVGLAPSVSDGSVVLTPQSVSIAGAEVSSSDLDQLPIDTSFLTQPLTVCAADHIPAGVAVTSVDTTNTHVAIALSFVDGFLDQIDPTASICF